MINFKSLLLGIILLHLWIASAFGASYFLHLTPAGLKQRRQIMQTPQSNSSQANKIFLKAAISHSKAAGRFSAWLQLDAAQADVNRYFDDLKNRHLADYLEPAGRFAVNPLTGDSLAGRQWYLKKIDIEAAWQRTQGSSQIIIGVIDTGIDYHHPDLQGSLWKNEAEVDGLPGVDDDGNGFVDDSVGWDFTDAPRFPDAGDYQQPDNDPMDEFGSGHGTQVAGIIAARSGNGIGISGVAPGVRVMNLRAGTASGYLEEDDVAQAILYALDNGARIVNMSFGDVALSRFLKEIIYYAYGQGLIMVASAGNSGDDRPNYPATLSQTISVGASTEQDYIAGFSTFGESLDLIAPGQDIVSTAVNGQYNTVNGTSFSAPMVSAVAGLILSLHPDYDAERIRNVLKTTADDIYYHGWDRYSGAGRLNAGRALNIPQAGILNIDYPQPNTSTAADSMVIIGSMLHPDIYRAEISYGVGVNPQRWQTLRTFSRQQVWQDTLAVLRLTTLPDTLITIRLWMELVNGQHDELRRSFYVDRSAPNITDVQIIPMYDGPQQAYLITFTSDDICQATLHMRPPGAQIFSESLPFGYETNVQRIKLSNAQYSGNYQFYIEAQNYSGLRVQETNQGNFYRLTFKDEFQWQEFVPLDWELPDGYLLDKTTDLDHDGKKEAILTRYTEQGGYGALEIYEFEGNRFEQRLGTGFPAIPRDAGDVDGDGRGDMLLGYGQHSLLFEAADGASFPDKLVWQDSSFWAAAYADMDGDGAGEIIGRRDSVYMILEDQGDGQFVFVQELPNPTNGENRYGIPRVLVADLTGDGHKEIAFGDYDGDVLIYAGTTLPGLYLLDTLRVLQSDATALLSASAAGDLFVASHSPANPDFEHEFDGRYRSIQRFRFDPTQSRFVCVDTLNIFGYHSLKDFDSGLQTAEFDGQPYLFAAFYPNLYIFGAAGAQITPLWQRGDAVTNTILTADFDGDGYSEFYYNNGEKIVGYSAATTERPFAPYPFTADPLDSARIRLQWGSVSGAEFYRLYKGRCADSLFFYRTNSVTVFTDTALANECTYFYAVTAVDSQRTVAESRFSLIDSAHTSRPPRLLNVLSLNERQLQLQFNEAVRFSTELPVRISATCSRQNALSALIMKDKRHIFCGFDSCFCTQDTITVANVFDRYGVPLDVRFARAGFTAAVQPHAPYLAQATVKSRYQVELRFSGDMDGSTVLNPENYRLEPAGHVQKIVAADSSYRIVTLHLSKHSMTGGLGQGSYLILTNLKSRDGQALSESGKINLFTADETLANVIIYPQPVKPQNEQLIFAHLPQDTQISIYTVNGRSVRILTEDLNFGGMSWDLKDRMGHNITSGVYLYVIRHGKEKKLGKIIILR